MLFIHGWCCDRSYFAPQVDHFSGTHRVVAVDQRGHGKSDAAADGDYSIAAFAADAAELIETLGLDRPVLVGHSLGGLVSLGLASARPDLVRGVVMVDPAPIVIGDELRAMFGGLLASLETDEGRRAFVAGMFAPTDDAERKARIVDSMSAVDPTVAVPALGGILDFDAVGALKTITVPVATIGSAVPINEGMTLREHRPDIIVGQTLGAGHFNQLEVPDQVNAMIEQFLRTALA